jgi:hypothetical protein
MRSAAVQLDEGLALLVMLAVKTLGKRPSSQPEMTSSRSSCAAFPVGLMSRGLLVAHNRPEAGAQKQ